MNRIKKNTEASSAEKYDVACKVLYGHEGITQEDMVNMFLMINDTEAYPIEIFAKKRECSAVCLVTPAAFGKLDYDYAKSGFCEFISNMLDEDHGCETLQFKDVKIWFCK